MNLLTAAALTRLKGEIAKDGREPSLAAKGSLDASPNGRTGASGNAGRTKSNVLVAIIALFMHPSLGDADKSLRKLVFTR